MPLQMPGTRELGPLMTTSTTTGQRAFKAPPSVTAEAGRMGLLLKGRTQRIVPMMWRHKDTKNGKARVSKGLRPWLILMELQFPVESHDT